MTAAGRIRPRVLHVIDNLAVGGTELALLGLVERTRECFDYSICCIRREGARTPGFEAAGAAVTFIGKAEGQDWRVPWRIARLCRRLRPHIVHTRNWGAIEGTLAARLAGVPVIIHGEHGRNAAAGAVDDRRRDRARRLLFRFVDRIVVVSGHLQRWALDEIGVSPHKVVFIPNGVDTDWYCPRAEREQLRRERGYEPTDVLIGAVGRLQPVKDYPTLIAAFEAVLRRQPETRLVIVGDGPERESLRDEIYRRGVEHAVRLAGHQDDVRDWLAAMDVFTQVSLMEGTSNAILEAMSAGLPVVATRVGGNPEVVQENATGRLVAAGDVAALAEHLAFYCGSAAARVGHGRAGRERVMAQYARARMIDAYVALYDDALRRRRVHVDATRPTASDDVVGA